MKLPKLYNYEIVKNTLELHKNKYLRIVEISHMTGLSYTQVSRMIHAAWQLGWVSRIEKPIHNNCFGTGKWPVIRTAYKIKRLESWNGIMPLSKKALQDRLKKGVDKNN